MHIQEFFTGIQRTEPTAAKLRRLEEMLGADRLSDPRLIEVKELFLADKAFDDYLACLIGPVLVDCSYTNYPLSALTNFAVHQLTMRRFEYTGSHKLVQIGCFTGEEFLCGIKNNISLDCHIVTSQTSRDPSHFSAERAVWDKPARVIPMSPEAYLRDTNPSIGALVLANLPAVADYRATLSAVWDRLDRFADVIIAGDAEALADLRSKLLFDGFYCSGLMIRKDCSADFSDAGIFLLSKERIDYQSIIMHDER